MKTCSRAFFLFFFLFVPSLFAFDAKGRVRLNSPLPPPQILDVPEKHRADCGKTKVSAKLQVSAEGFVANAVVRLKGTFGEQKPEESKGEFILDQRGCEFSPHVILIPKGADLSILNSDGFLHNVRAFDEGTEMLFNDAMPKKGQVLKRRFEMPGRFLLRCGLHSWMHAFVIVREHPYYAVTDNDGNFTIRGIPKGKHRLEVWHETLGILEADLSPETPSLALTYPSPSTQ